MVRPNILTMQRKLAEEKAQLAQEALDQMWPGKTTVRVTVELDPNWETGTVLRSDVAQRLARATAVRDWLSRQLMP